jgi:hypothetical protein
VKFDAGLRVLGASFVRAVARRILFAAGVCLLAGAALVGRFILYFIRDPARSGHTESLILGVGIFILAFLGVVMAAVADLIEVNRRLLEEVRGCLERLEAAPFAGLTQPQRTRSGRDSGTIRAARGGTTTSRSTARTSG